MLLFLLSELLEIVLEWKNAEMEHPRWRRAYHRMSQKLSSRLGGSASLLASKDDA
jgi:hypothetical protein